MHAVLVGNGNRSWLPLDSVPSCLQAGRGLPTAVKVDAYRRVKEGVWEWWSTYQLQINTDKPPEAVSSAGGSSSSSSNVTGSNSSGGSGRGAGSGGGSSAAGAANENQPRQPSGDRSGAAAVAPAAPAAKGKRYRLLPLSESLQRALPAEGKITVLYGGHTCEAQLTLPASETRWGPVGLALLPPPPPPPRLPPFFGQPSVGASFLGPGRHMICATPAICTSCP